MPSRSYRAIYFGLAMALVAVVSLGIAFGSPDGGAPGIPEPLEAVEPPTGSQSHQLARIEIDVPVGYEAVLWIDFRGNADNSANWYRIPTDEILVVEPTGVYSWQPGPGKILENWEPGTQRVRVTWDTTTGLPDPGVYDWSFRISG